MPISGLPAAERWLRQQVSDERTRRRWIGLARSLAAVVAAGAATWWIAELLVRLPRRAIERHQVSGPISRLLLASLVDMARAHGFHSVIARVVGGHEASITLHRSCGFELVGIEREIGRKFGRWLDAAFYQLNLETPVAPVDC